MNILKIYWLYQIIKNIKNNNIKLVKLLVEKHFKDTFNNYFFKISHSYSYDCFDYFYKRLKIKNGDEYFLPYYRKIHIKNNANFIELAKIFHYSFGQKKESTMQDIDSDEEIDRLRYQIINYLINKNKFEDITCLVKDLSQRSKNSIFKSYLTNYIKFNKNHIEKLISILNIEQRFFEKKILDCYHPDLDKNLYDFMRNNYNIDKKYYICSFLRIDNEEVIKQIDYDFNISFNVKIQKIHDSLLFNYKYQNGKETIDIIKFYQSLGYLNEETILKSFKTNNSEIIIDFIYLPLLNLSKETEIIMLKKNLKIIIFNKQYHFNYKEHDNLKDIITKLDSYFDFIQDKIDINNDSMFIEELLESIYVNSEDIFIYFYKKFPELFIKKSLLIFSTSLNCVKDTNRIMQEVLNETNHSRKRSLLKSFLKAYQKILHHHDKHNISYFLIKNDIHDEDKQSLLHNKIIYSVALPIIKDILQEDFLRNINISDLFLNSICGFSKNSIYLLENYSIDITTLTNGFMKLIHHENNETNLLLASKILEKSINLNDYEQYLVKEHNIGLYKLYQSYSLNRKLESKYQIKNTKQKVVKI